MNGKVARAHRREVYGVDGSKRFRELRINRKTGVVIADEKRQEYQRAKGRKKWDTI